MCGTHQGQPRFFVFLLPLLLHASISTVETGAGDTAGDAECGCSGGLSRDLPAGGHDISSGGGGGGSSTAPNDIAVTDSEGMTTGEEAAEEGHDVVLVEAGDFRFGTDTPFIVPVCRSAVEVKPGSL